MQSHLRSFLPSYNLWPCPRAAGPGPLTRSHWLSQSSEIKVSTETQSPLHIPFSISLIAKAATATGPPNTINGTEPMTQVAKTKGAAITPAIPPNIPIFSPPEFAYPMGSHFHSYFKLPCQDAKTPSGFCQNQIYRLNRMNL